MNLFRQALEDHRDRLLELPNVVGVGIGYREVGGERTPDLAVVVFVEKKLPPDALPRAQLVPRRVNNLPTDVVAVGKVRLLGERTGRMRPAAPGVSIGHYRITAGTLGAVVVDKNGAPLILSNNHILANRSNGADGRAQTGDPVLQPGPYDGGDVRRDRFARLVRFVALQYSPQAVTCPVAARIEYLLNTAVQSYHPAYAVRMYRRANGRNVVDAAVAAPLNPRDLKTEILEIGKVTGTVEAEIGMPVKKSGRTSGVTGGAVNYVHATVTVDVGEGSNAVFDDQVVTSALSKPGDSGSLVVDEKNRAVGLLFAGSENTTVCNRINNVLRALAVRFP
ncbi:MAG: hypothetical protein AB1776_01340 [Bacillota bacterium]